MGEEGLSDTDRTYLTFGERFEDELVRQPAPRTLEQSMAVGWQVLAALPDSELSRLSNEQIATHVRGGKSRA